MHSAQNMIKCTDMRYPKLLGLTLSTLLAYALHQQGVFAWVLEGTMLERHGVLSYFLAGFLFSFGFTSSFAVAMLVALPADLHVLPASLTAGVGALLADYCIFSFIRFSLRDELHRLKSTRIFRCIYAWIHHPSISEKIRLYLLWSIAGIVIASPLPDEIGVSLISGVTQIDSRKFVLLCLALNTVGVLLILLMARA